MDPTVAMADWTFSPSDCTPQVSRKLREPCPVGHSLNSAVYLPTNDVSIVANSASTSQTLYHPSYLCDLLITTTRLDPKKRTTIFSMYDFLSLSVYPN